MPLFKAGLLASLVMQSLLLTQNIEKVIGVDINAAMQPEEIPENLYLQVDDLNRRCVGNCSVSNRDPRYCKQLIHAVRFTFPAHNFDLVHSQMMSTGIHTNRWTTYLQDIFNVTRGGGWCQMVELYYNAQSE